jgi:hypothetical protein
VDVEIDFELLRRRRWPAHQTGEKQP